MPIEVPADAWDLRRAAQFLGISPRTLERYVTRRMIPCLVYPPARVDAAGEAPSGEARPATGTRKGTKPMIAFDPATLAAWRERHAIGHARAS